MFSNQEIKETPQDTIDLIVNIHGFKSADGKVSVGLFSSSDTWLTDAFMSQTGEISHLSSTVTFKNVPKGDYGVSLYHDENNNDKMDTGMFRIPTEDYGCSNGARGRFGPPKWKDAVFNLSFTKDILIKL
jgi:uncharacterized protein (DUF2141 family)